MGYTQAAEFAGMGVDLEVAINWHLRHNHYPPHPAFMVPIAIEAIEAGREQDWDHRIELPEGVSFRKQTYVTAAQAIESFHLEPWLDYTGEEE